MKAFLNKVKFYVIGFVLLAGLLLIIQGQRKSIKRLNDKVVRLSGNIEQLLQDNATQTALVLTQKEVTGKVKRERDSLAKALRIAPKQVVKYIDRIIVQHDTIIKEVVVTPIGKNEWSIIDKGQCFVWQGKANLISDSLHVSRTDFFYSNNIVDVFFWKRKFWIFSKKKYFQETRQECGKSETKTITFVKK